MSRDARQEPQNLEAEEYVVGAMMLSEWAIDACVDECGPGDFYRETHGKMFAAAAAMRAEGRPVDPITLGAELESRGQLAEVGGLERIRELATLVPATSNAGHHARIVREKSIRRGLGNAGRALYGLSLDVERPTVDLVDEAERLVFDLARSGERNDPVSLADTVPLVYRQLEALHSGEITQIGLPTGFKDVDSMTAGLQPGNLIIVAGRPSMGKTALAICVLAHVTMREEVPALIFTLEMSRLEVTQRLVGIEGQIDSTKFRTGALDGGEWHRATRASNELSRAPLFIDDQRVITVSEIRSKARHLKMRNPDLGLIVVDYLQLMTAEGNAENRVQALSQISRSLKLLAGELDVPVIAISQLSRAPEGRHDRRPILSDLRESGALEQDADVVAFVYRDEYYHPEEDDQKGVAEVIFAKHRNGPTDTVKLAFAKRYARFTDLALEQQ